MCGRCRFVSSCSGVAFLAPLCLAAVGAAAAAGTAAASASALFSETMAAGLLWGTSGSGAVTGASAGGSAGAIMGMDAGGLAADSEAASPLSWASSSSEPSSPGFAPFFFRFSRLRLFLFSRSSCYTHISWLLYAFTKGYRLTDSIYTPCIYYIANFFGHASPREDWGHATTNHCSPRQKSDNLFLR